MATTSKALNPRKAKFIKEFIRTGNQRQSALAAWPNQSPSSATVTASRTLQDANICNAVRDEMARQGLTLDYLIKKLKTLLDGDNQQIILQSLKVAGEFSRITAQKNGTTNATQVNINNGPSEETLKELISRIDTATEYIHKEQAASQPLQATIPTPQDETP